MERLGLVESNSQSESSNQNDVVDMTQRSFEGAKPERDIGDSGEFTILTCLILIGRASQAKYDIQFVT